MRKELILPVTAIVGGAIGFFLRRQELLTAFEPDTGLPIEGMPVTWALIALSAAVAVVLLLLCLGVGKGFEGGYDQAFRARDAGPFLMGMTAGTVLTAAGGVLLVLKLPRLYAEASLETSGFPMFSLVPMVLLAVLCRFPMFSLVPMVLLAVLCLCSAWSMLMLGKNNYRGEEKGKYSAWLLIPAYTCCMWLIVSYQEHSGDPIILDYVYQLFSVIAAVLGCYFLSGFGFGRSRPAAAAFFSAEAMYFALVTLADAHEPAFLLLYAGCFFYFAASSVALLYNLGRPLGPRMPGGKRLSADEKINREERPHEG